MATLTIQPGRLANNEDMALGSIDSQSRSSSESTAIEKSGDEEAFLPPSQTKQKEDKHPSSVSRMKLLLWMLANTLATIGIVRRELPPPSPKVRSISNQTSGLHQQISLLPLFIQTRPTDLRLLPFLHDQHTTLRALSPAYRLLRAQTGQNPRNATTGRSYVSERDTAKLLARLLLHPLLPDLPRPTHAYRRRA